jgi:hypothetical protein
MKSLLKRREWSSTEIKDTTTALFGLTSQLEALLAANPHYVTTSFQVARHFLQRLEDILHKIDRLSLQMQESGLFIEIRGHLVSIRIPIYYFMVDPHVVDKRQMFAEMSRDFQTLRYRGNGGIWVQVVKAALRLEYEIAGFLTEIETAFQQFQDSNRYLCEGLFDFPQ